MYDIEMHEASVEFAKCYEVAGHHIMKCAQGPVSWLKADCKPPFLDHMSFRLGNQLFFVRLEDVNGRLEVPGVRRGLATIADECKGHACVMGMTRERSGWQVAESGWGLRDLATGHLVDPVALITDEPVEMTDWELQDFAVQVVRHHLKEKGYEIMSSQGNPSVTPSLWFVGDTGPEWVVVRAVKYPGTVAEKPENWDEIVASCTRGCARGSFASVSVASADTDFSSAATESVPPLLRGGGMHVRFEGLEYVPSTDP